MLFSDCCGAEAGEMLDIEICPACKEHCEWVDDENENNHPTRAKLINLGWANGWPEGKLPPIANACQLAFMDGEPHNYYEQPQPHLGSCVHRVVCETCGYEYLYDSGD